MQLTIGDGKLTEILLHLGVAKNKNEARGILSDKIKRRKMEAFLATQGGIGKS